MVRAWKFRSAGCDGAGCQHGPAYVVTYKDGKRSKVCEWCVRLDRRDPEVDTITDLAARP